MSFVGWIVLLLRPWNAPKRQFGHFLKRLSGVTWLAHRLGAGKTLAYWYPQQGHISSLEVLLEKTEEIAGAAASDKRAYVVRLSRVLAAGANSDGISKAQLTRWVWVASQFRIHGGASPEVARCAGGALEFLAQKLQRGLTEQDVQELNWALDHVVAVLGELVPPSALRTCLSPEELERIEERLTSYKDAPVRDEDRTRAAVTRQLDVLSQIVTGRDFDSLQMKVDALFSCWHGKGAQAGIARAALFYLADEEDVVSDALGSLGLLDDVYVIEWAYAVVENQTRCLPILNHLLERYPFVAELALVGNPAQTLSKYAQYVGATALDVLFARRDPSMLVLRDAAPFGVLSGSLAAIQCARVQLEEDDQLNFSLHDGEAITISDGTVKFKAIYRGLIQLGKQTRHRIGVGDAGTITIPHEVAQYISHSTVRHAKLSSGSEIGAWVKGRHADPLLHLTGGTRIGRTAQRSALLVCQRQKLEEYIQCLKPLGSSIPALFGVKYIGRDLVEVNIGNTSTDTPYLYACSDVDAAHEVIRRPPQGTKDWAVVIDGARKGQVLLDALSSDGDPLPPLCIIAELHEREAAREIARRGVAAWYLEDQDVDVPPTAPIKPKETDDALTRALRRQGNYWAQSQTVHEIRNPQLETIAAWLGPMNRQSQNDWRKSIDISVAQYLRLALGSPLASVKTDQALATSARQIALSARQYRSFDPELSELCKLFQFAMDGCLPQYSRAEQLAKLATTIRSGEKVAVLARSTSVALDCRSLSVGPELEKFEWAPLDEIRRDAPYDRIIVSGWADRISLRELGGGGLASRLELILLPFERERFEGILSASNRWERTLEAETAHRLESVASHMGPTELTSMWRRELDNRIHSAPAGVVTQDDSAETVDLDLVDARAIEAITEAYKTDRGAHHLVSARLVMFEEPGAFAFLPPQGKVIVLSTGDDPIVPAEGTQVKNAERMLLRKVKELLPGYLLALARDSDRDLVDAKADQFLRNPAEVRGTASLWKAALKRHFEGSEAAQGTFLQRLANAGETRDVSTVRAWVGGTRTVAPRHWRRMVPLIAAIVQDKALASRLDQVLASIDLIYRARERAADALIREIFSGKLDLNAEEIAFELDGSNVRYALHRVSSIQGTRAVPHEVVGRVQYAHELAAIAA